MEKTYKLRSLSSSTTHHTRYVNNLYILNLEGCAIVLGALWPQTLGPIVWDVSNLLMKLNFHDKEYQLRG